jgi:hypothetical protein
MSALRKGILKRLNIPAGIYFRVPFPEQVAVLATYPGDLSPCLYLP